MILSTKTLQINLLYYKPFFLTNATARSFFCIFH